MIEPIVISVNDAQLLKLAKELVTEARKRSPSRDHMNEILGDMIASQKHTDVRFADRRSYVPR